MISLGDLTGMERLSVGWATVGWATVSRRDRQLARPSAGRTVFTASTRPSTTVCTGLHDYTVRIRQLDENVRKFVTKWALRGWRERFLGNTFLSR